MKGYCSQDVLVHCFSCLVRHLIQKPYMCWRSRTYGWHRMRLMYWIVEVDHGTVGTVCSSQILVCFHRCHGSTFYISSFSKAQSLLAALGWRHGASVDWRIRVLCSAMCKELNQCFLTCHFCQGSSYLISQEVSTTTWYSSIFPTNVPKRIEYGQHFWHLHADMRRLMYKIELSQWFKPQQAGLCWMFLPMHQ